MKITCEYCSCLVESDEDCPQCDSQPVHLDFGDEVITVNNPETFE
jgi:RNA polymerase subunit RPABC4/transcription elongation factor Spt4